MAWVAELLGVQTDLAWVDRRAVLDGLPDDEYRWEPVQGCWSLRPRADAQARCSASVRSIDEAAVTGLRSTHWGGRMPLARIVSDMAIEYAHHLAEIGTLRDLRRGHALPQTPPAELEAPRWWQAGR